MAQKLILPINKMRLTAGYKNANYKKQFGYTHYGVDMTDKDRQDLTVYGSGNGEVMATGWSDSSGNVLIVKYSECVLKNGQVLDLIIRYYHLGEIFVQKGQKITKDTIIANYGNTGSATSGAHLHIEIDKDVKYYAYTPQIAKNNGILKAGIDTTLNPVDVLHVKTTKPDYQSITNAGYNTVSASDLNYKEF